MPRYFFHLHNDAIVRDTEGDELPSLEAAREEALWAARSLMCLSVQKGRLNLSHRVEVMDERGKCVLALPFRDALTISS